VILGDTTIVRRASEVSNDFATLVQSRSRAPEERKALPSAAIRVLKRDAHGNRRSRAYSGWRTLVRVSDGNPGVFVRLLNVLGIQEGVQAIDPTSQHEGISRLATAWHEWSQALYKDGNVLFNLIESLGADLSERLHTKAVTDEHLGQETNRFRVNLAKLGPKLGEAFKVGARHGLLVAEAEKTSYRYPLGVGVWRLAYFLAPKFWLLPRKGRVAQFLEGQQLTLSFAKPERGQLAFDETPGESAGVGIPEGESPEGDDDV
jgi:hypothetical protein